MMAEMSIAKQDREENHKTALQLMLQTLGDGAIDTTLFQTDNAPFAGNVLRTTWEELVTQGCVAEVAGRYRLTPKGWLAALEACGASGTKQFQERLGRILAAMKRHVKGRRDPAVIELQQLAAESGEPAVR